MIINHKYKFIFIKTRKTAGSSIEIALSKFCSHGDVITPIKGDNDDHIRQELGFIGPQNYYTSRCFYTKRDWLGFLFKGQQKEFFQHATAEFVRDNIEPEIWNTYFKFCFERDPFDKAISRYYWSTRNAQHKPEMTDYLNSARVKFLSNWKTYTINDHLAVDFVGRYETLADDLAMIGKTLGLPGELSLPQAKTGYRSNRKHYSQVLDSQARTRIELACAKEMQAFDYSWCESQPKQLALKV
ncbi:MAG: sulfotransferase family protein [Leptolyngbya sp. SIO1D8]|nr:sulfotransferase family protein [Leptolyngbya sp. SIO1D8]